jgi:hypothetical protein
MAGPGWLQAALLLGSAAAIRLEYSLLGPHSGFRPVHAGEVVVEKGADRENRICPYVKIRFDQISKTR